jgi:phosphoglycolate phosphatase
MYTSLECPAPRNRIRPEDVRAILFDFDGTLVHLNIDFGRMREEVEAILPRYGLSLQGKEHLYTLELIEDSVETLAARDGPAAAAAFRHEAHDTVVAVEMEAAEQAEVHPGVPELLQELRDRGLRIGIVTRNCRAAVERILQRNALPHDALVTRDDVRAVKPQPEHLLTALRELEVQPEQTLIVGDHPLDVRAGRLAGVGTVAVLTGHSPAERFVPEEPDLILEEVSLLRDHLAQSRSKPDRIQD